MTVRKKVQHVFTPVDVKVQTRESEFEMRFSTSALLQHTYGKRVYASFVGDTANSGLTLLFEGVKVCGTGQRGTSTFLNLSFVFIQHDGSYGSCAVFHSKYVLLPLAQMSAPAAVIPALHQIDIVGHTQPLPGC